MYDNISRHADLLCRLTGHRVTNLRIEHDRVTFEFDDGWMRFVTQEGRPILYDDTYRPDENGDISISAVVSNIVGRTVRGVQYEVYYSNIYRAQYSVIYEDSGRSWVMDGARPQMDLEIEWETDMFKDDSR